MLIVLLACLLGHVVAASVPDECPRIMFEAGLRPTFAPMVTHNIHSLTLEDIRYYFKSDATEDNGIPTVNMDLASEERVLPNAPLVGYDEDFSTMGLKTFDLVMRNMNRTWWGITNYSVLEKVAHALHMAEVWTKAMEKYKYIGKLLNPESDICACVTDIDNNGVLNYLNLLAFKIRYPGITSGNENITNHYLDPIRNLTDAEIEDSMGRVKRSPLGDWDWGIDFEDGLWGSYEDGGYNIGGSIEPDFKGVNLGGHASYEQDNWKITANADAHRSWGGDTSWEIGIGFTIDFRSHKFDDIDFSLSDVKLLKDVAEKLVDEDTVMMHHIDSPEHWEYWKNILKMSKDDPGHYDLAMFMFCMLN